MNANANANTLVSSKFPQGGGGGGALLLDDYTGAYYAWSVARKLRTAYSGALIRVRRSNDNSELDIGFNGSNELDTAALNTFVGSNNAFIVTKYDQSGNGRNWTQATAGKQPRIMNAGVLDTENGKPCAVYINNIDQMFLTGIVLTGITSAMLFYTFKLTLSGSNIHNGSGNNSGSAWLTAFINGDNTSPSQNSGTLSYYKNGTIISGATRNTLYNNFINSPSIMTIKNINFTGIGWTTLIADGYGTGNNFRGTFSEDIMYSTQTNSQSGIENNIKAFYGII